MKYAKMAFLALQLSWFALSSQVQANTSQTNSAAAPAAEPKAVIKSTPGAKPAASQAESPSASPPKHGKVEVSSAPQGDKLQLKFRIVPDPEHKLSFEAPWSLDIKQADGLKFEKTQFKRGDLDQALPGFVTEASSQVKGSPASVQYKLIAFICTKDIKTCYREEFVGVHDVK